MQSLLFKYIISKIYNLFFSINTKSTELKLSEKFTRCLVLGSCIEDVIAGMGATLVKNSARFDVYSLTNGFRKIADENLTYEEKVEKRKNDFLILIEELNVNYYHFFDDIDENRLVMRYDKFKTINISDYDYIFIPNILESNRDNKSVAILLNELLKEKAYKNSVKIVMYEINSTLALPNAFVDIDNVLDKKVEILQRIEPKSLEITKAINSFRGLSNNRNSAEAFCVLDIDDFKKICKVY